MAKADGLDEIELGHEGVKGPKVKAGGVIAADGPPSRFGDVVDGGAATEDKERVAVLVLLKVDRREQRNAQTPANELLAPKIEQEIFQVKKAEENGIRQGLGGILQPVGH